MINGSRPDKLIFLSNVNDLIKHLKDKDPTIRKEAAKALGMIGDVRAIKPLIDRLKRENMGVVISAIEDTLKKIGPPAVEPLISALKDKDCQNRYQVTKLLGLIRDDRAVEPLIAALNDKEGRVREEAARALGIIKDARAVAYLIIALRDSQPSVSAASADALGQIGNHHAIDPLVNKLLNTIVLGKDYYGREMWHIDPNCTHRTALALAQIGDVRALAPLLVYLKACNHMIECPDPYRGTMFEKAGAHVERLDALEAIVQFARSCRTIPNGWKKIKVHIDEYYEWYIDDITNIARVKEDIELPVSIDKSSVTAETNVFRLLLFPVEQHFIEYSRIYKIKTGESGPIAK